MNNQRGAPVRKNGVKKIYRGSVWFVDLDPTVGHEQAKKRPCIILSDTNYNNGPAHMVVVVPLTSKYKDVVWLVSVTPPDGGLKVKSYALIDQIRSVSIERFSGASIGEVSVDILSQIEERLRFLLHL